MILGFHSSVVIREVSKAGFVSRRHHDKSPKDRKVLLRVEEIGDVVAAMGH